MAQYYLDDKEFGRMIISTRIQSRSIIFRWKSQILHITCHPSSTTDEIRKNIEEMRQKIRNIKKESISYHVGQVIECFKCKVTIGNHGSNPGKVGYGGKIPDLYINVHKDIDFSNPITSKTISICLENLMILHAEEVLIPYAISVARDLGVEQKNFVIGRGKQKLGHCTNKKTIQLSRNLMFMPERIVRYIICHELAHLTHMNHGVKFHDLCNKYCDGNEANLEAELRKFRLPLIG